MKTDAPTGAAAAATEVRNYWRSILISTALRQAWLLGLCRNSETQITNLPEHVQQPLIAKVRELLDRVCKHEQETGRRTQSMEQRCDASLWNFLKPYKAREFDGPPPTE